MADQPIPKSQPSSNSIDVDAFMQHVGDRGFNITDYGVVSGVRRFDILKLGDHNLYFDIDMIIWPDVTQEWLLRQVDIILDGWKPIEASG